jgi:flagellar hook protein FlgE
MLGIIYTGLSGLTAYSRGLEVISNNVANLNTPGFKVSVPMFREVMYQQLRAPNGNGAGVRPGGAGVAIDAADMSFRSGELRDSGNALDAAIDGNGFFVLDMNGDRVYTRAGQFAFDKDGVLVERVTGAKVVVSTDTVSQSTFDLDTARVFEPRATTEVMLTGSLARASGSTNTHELPNITVFDSAGTSVPLRVNLTRNADDFLRWTVELLKPDNTVIGQADIQFNENGTPAENANSITVTLDTDSSPPFDVKFNFGKAGSFSGVTAPASNNISGLQMLQQDGFAIGSLTATQFDDNGHLQLSYSNGETRTVATLVLARFDSPDQLQVLGHGLFAATDRAQPVMGGALASGIGRVVGGRVELSNVELTEQFTDLIIMQRGYQASSQINSVANEMILQLLSMDKPT